MRRILLNEHDNTCPAPLEDPRVRSSSPLIERNGARPISRRSPES